MWEEYVKSLIPARNGDNQRPLRLRRDLTPVCQNQGSVKKLANSIVLVVNDQPNENIYGSKLRVGNGHG